MFIAELSRLRAGCMAAIEALVSRLQAAGIMMPTAPPK